MGVVTLIVLGVLMLGCAPKEPLWRCESHEQAQIFIDDVRHGVMRERTSCWRRVQ